MFRQESHCGAADVTNLALELDVSLSFHSKLGERHRSIDCSPKITMERKLLVEKCLSYILGFSQFPDTE